MIFIGFELGLNVLTAGWEDVLCKLDKDHPLKVAFVAFIENFLSDDQYVDGFVNQRTDIKNYKGRHSWDPLTVLFAVRGFENYCEKVHGRNEIFNYQPSSKNVQKASLSDGKIEYDPSDTIEVDDIIYGYDRWKVCNEKDFYLSW